MKTIDLTELKSGFLQDRKILDVRAPLEFAQGALPNSVNLPILNDEERALVGTCYKKSGQEKAIELGHRLVSGENKQQKVAAWKNFVLEHPHAVMTCFRGGLRSRISQQFLLEAGIEISRLERGYKEARQFLIDELISYSETCQLRILTGNTGSGKTKILREASRFYPAVDLEHLAQHRGSAFGSMKNPQPAQASFENQLAVEILKIRNKVSGPPVLFEDESRLIGRIHLPEKFFAKLRSSAVIKMNVSLEARIENIFIDYIFPEAAIFQKYSEAINRISKKLGGARTQELLVDIKYSQTQFAELGLLETNRVWIEKLLVWYYDPMYTYSLSNRKPEIEFEGSDRETIEYLERRS